MSEPKKENQYSEPSYAQPRSEKPAWYPASIDKHLVPSTRKLLQEYSGVGPSSQSQHVHEIREKAWAIRTYPCTGLGLWLVPYIGLSPAYPTILQRLKDGEAMVDVGCFTGGDFRQCVFDGAPSESMVGVDIADHWGIGYDLYRDGEKFKGRFVEADVMNVGTEKSAPELEELKGGVSVIHICQVLHQWNWGGQVEACKKLVFFSQPGTLVVGYQIGDREGKEITMSQVSGSARVFRHSPDSFQMMWERVGEETGTRWEVQARMLEWRVIGLEESDVEFMRPEDRPVEFVVERVE